MSAVAKVAAELTALLAVETAARRVAEAHRLGAAVGLAETRQREDALGAALDTLDRVRAGGAS